MEESTIPLYKLASPPPPPRREMVRFRASLTELEAWEKARQSQGFASLSDFLREAARRLIFEDNGDKKEAKA